MGVKFSFLFLSCVVLLLVHPLSAAGTNAEATSRPVAKVRAEKRALSVSREDEYERPMAEGKELYLEEMDNEAALEKFKRAEAAAQTREQKAEVYQYLSLIYYSFWGTEARQDLVEAMDTLVQITDSMRKLIETDYYRELDKFLCPPKYIEVYEKIKKQYGAVRIQSSPPGAEVFLDESSQAVGTTPLTVGHTEGHLKIRVRLNKKEKSGVLTVKAGQEAQSPLYSLKKRSGLFFWLGGAVLAGGMAAALLWKKKEPHIPSGIIQVYSTPQGAEVYLDGSSTNKVTDCTLNDVAVGQHSLELVKEGYVVYKNTNVVVLDGQITTVSVTLEKNTITVTQPAGDTWETGEDVWISWETGGEAELNMDSVSNPITTHQRMGGAKRFSQPEGSMPGVFSLQTSSGYKKEGRPGIFSGHRINTLDSCSGMKQRSLKNQDQKKPPGICTIRIPEAFVPLIQAK